MAWQGHRRGSVTASACGGKLFPCLRLRRGVGGGAEAAGAPVGSPSTPALVITSRSCRTQFSWAPAPASLIIPRLHWKPEAGGGGSGGNCRLPVSGAAPPAPRPPGANVRELYTRREAVHREIITTVCALVSGGNVKSQRNGPCLPEGCPGQNEPCK